MLQTHSLTGPRSSWKPLRPPSTWSLARFQEIATKTPVLDLIWLMHQKRGRPLGSFQDVRIRSFMDVSLHNLRAMLQETSAGRQTTWPKSVYLRAAMRAPIWGRFVWHAMEIFVTRSYQCLCASYDSIFSNLHTCTEYRIDGCNKNATLDLHLALV